MKPQNMTDFECQVNNFAVEMVVQQCQTSFKDASSDDEDGSSDQHPSGGVGGQPTRPKKNMKISFGDAGGTTQAPKFGIT